MSDTWMQRLQRLERATELDGCNMRLLIGMRTTTFLNFDIGMASKGVIGALDFKNKKCGCAGQDNKSWRFCGLIHREFVQ